MVLNTHFWLSVQRLLLVRLRGSHLLLRMKTESATGKASVLPAVLLLWHSKFLFFYPLFFHAPDQGHPPEYAPNRLDLFVIKMPC